MSPIKRDAITMSSNNVKCVHICMCSEVYMCTVCACADGLEIENSDL